MVLAWLQQGINEPLAKYVQRYKAVAAMGANYELLESIVRDSFLEGMVPDLLERVIPHSPGTLEAAIEQATVEEQTRKPSIGC